MDSLPSTDLCVQLPLSVSSSPVLLALSRAFTTAQPCCGFFRCADSVHACHRYRVEMLIPKKTRQEIYTALFKVRDLRTHTHHIHDDHGVVGWWCCGGGLCVGVGRWVCWRAGAIAACTISLVALR